MENNPLFPSRFLKFFNGFFEILIFNQLIEAKVHIYSLDPRVFYMSCFLEFYLLLIR